MNSQIKILFVAAALLAGFSAHAQIDETAIKDQNAFDATSPSGIVGGGAVYSDTNVGGFSFDRTLSDCNGISGLGPVLGSQQLFSVSATGPYDFSSTQDYDGYIHIYETAFDSTNAELNCVIGDDDGPGGIGTSEILGVTLNAGVQYVAVTSAFAAGGEGTFTNTIAGAGAVTLGQIAPQVVPTLSTFGLVAMLLALGLVAAVVLVRRS